MYFTRSNSAGTRAGGRQRQRLNTSVCKMQVPPRMPTLIGVECPQAGNVVPSRA